MKPPRHWKQYQSLEFPIRSGNRAATVWEHELVDLRVFRSISRMEDGSEWIHVSVARPDRIPSWKEIAKVKEEFIGQDKEAYHVIPSLKDHVNVHNFCMHLWSPVRSEHKLPNLKNLVFEGEY